MVTREPSERYRSPASVFVGRERELTELRGGLTDALAGRGRLFLLVGDPGIGKTRLADEIAVEAAARGATVLWGRGWEDGGAPAFWPWIQIIRALVRPGGADDVAADLRALGDGARRIAQVVPEVRTLVPELAPDGTLSGPGGETERFPLFDALTTWLVRTTTRRPLVIVLDDLHAADTASLALLQFVARELRDSRLLIVGTYRADAVQHDPERAALLSRAARFGHRLPLAGLSTAEVGQLLTHGFALPVSLAPLVHATTEGNPLFVDEVVRVLAAEHGGNVPETMTAADLRIPHGLHDAMRTRLQAVSGECLRILRVAAVMGREFDLAVLEAVVACAAGEVLDRLAEAARAGLVAPSGLARYAFTHALIRETLCTDTSAAQQAQLHRQVGEALERRGAGRDPARAAELAYHFLRTTDAADKAVTYSFQAGHAASAQLAFEEATLHFERALQTLLSQPIERAARRCEILLALGEAYVRAGDLARATQRFLDAVTDARHDANADLFARAVLGFADVGLGVPHRLPDPQIVALIDEARQRLGSGDHVLHAQLLARLAKEHRAAPDQAPRLTFSQQAVDMARRLGDPMTLAAALSARHFVLWNSPDVDARLQLASETIALADQLGDRETALLARTNRIVDLMWVGDPRRLDAEIALHGQLTETVRHPRHLWMTALFQAMRALWRGQWDVADSFAQHALALGERTGSQLALINPWVQVFAVRRAQGRLAQEEHMLHPFVHWFPDSPVPGTLLAVLHCELDRPDQARAEFDRVAHDDFAALAQETRLDVLPFLAEVAAAVSDTRRAQVLYRLLQPYKDRNVTFGPSVCLGATDHYLAILAATMRQLETAEQHFEVALTRHQMMDGKPWLAGTQFEYARMLAERGAPGDAARAIHLAGTATDLAQQLAMPTLAQRATTLLRRLPPVDQPAQSRVRAAGGTRLAPVPGSSTPVEATPRGARLLRILPGHGNATSPTTANERESGATSRATVAAGEAVFRREGEYWSVGDAHATARIKASKGLHYLGQLLRHPGREFHVTDLAATQFEPSAELPSATASDAHLADLGMRDSRPGDLGVLVDAQAKAAYRDRLEDLRDQLDEATRFNDRERAARLQQEIDALARELARAVGLGGRNRVTASHAERVRLNVTRAIRAAIDRIAQSSPAVAGHLRTTVRTGTFCSYTPDPRFPLSWRLD